VMTALPVRPAIPPEQVLLFIQAMRERLAIVILDEQDYIDATRDAAGLGFTSGRIYDALLLKCAAKVRARTIYTWNLKHFRLIDPGQADRIRTP
jgi:predicted nucleic acid-binding protein